MPSHNEDRVISPIFFFEKLIDTTLYEKIIPHKFRCPAET